MTVACAQTPHEYPAPSRTHRGHVNIAEGEDGNNDTEPQLQPENKSDDLHESVGPPNVSELDESRLGDGRDENIEEHDVYGCRRRVPR